MYDCEFAFDSSKFQGKMIRVEESAHPKCLWLPNMQFGKWFLFDCLFRLCVKGVALEISRWIYGRVRMTILHFPFHHALKRWEIPTKKCVRIAILPRMPFHRTLAIHAAIVTQQLKYRMTVPIASLWPISPGKYMSEERMKRTFFHAIIYGERETTRICPGYGTFFFSLAMRAFFHEQSFGRMWVHSPW